MIFLINRARLASNFPGKATDLLSLKEIVGIDSRSLQQRNAVGEKKQRNPKVQR